MDKEKIKLIAQTLISLGGLGLSGFVIVNNYPNNPEHIAWASGLAGTIVE